MLRMTKQTDYGFVLLSHLANEAAGEANAPELASETKLPLPMVSKILKLLVRQGLLLSHRGVKGGYSLARPAAEITAAFGPKRSISGPSVRMATIAHIAANENVNAASIGGSPARSRITVNHAESVM